MSLPEPYYDQDGITIFLGDCRDVMATLPEASVDAVVTDPPYGLGFMGKDWDHEVPGVAFWEAMYRVMKPGAHLLAFGGTRTFHRITVAIEDAGFEIRDTLMWLYGSGFPKSHDVSKAIDKAAGAKREVIGDNPNRKGRQPEGYHDGWARPWQADAEAMAHKITAPATPEAEQWQGWGTALKPAYEPIILARKPLSGTVAANVLAHGTGALNIDACRIGTETWTRKGGDGSTPYGSERTWSTSKTPDIDRTATGRWPANVILDEVATAQLDQMSGERKSGVDNGKPRAYHGDVYNTRTGQDNATHYGDTVGASRFFYVAKASRRERGEGNTHPTVKPIALMRYLITLITPPGGTVLDPFMGSGSTGVACSREGVGFIGIELNPEYAEIARRRIVGDAPLFANVEV